MLIQRGEETNAIVEIVAESTLPEARISCITWSYGGAGTLSGGELSVNVNGTEVWGIDIDVKGPGAFNFPLALWEDDWKGQELSITLAAGGADVVGKLNVIFA